MTATMLRILSGLSMVGLLLCVSVAVAEADEGEGTPGSEEKPAAAMIDSWHTSAGQTSLVLSIRPDGWALVMWIRSGQRSMDTVPWKAVADGVVVQDTPAIRLWRGRHDQELRAELEPAIPGTDYDPNDFFRQRFLVRRIVKRHFPAATLDRALPESWTSDAAGESWDTAKLQAWIDEASE